MSERKVPPEEIGAAVKALRKRRSFTQADLAHEAGVSVTTVRNVEKGNFGNPYSLPRIATALEVDVDKLVSAPASLTEDELLRMSDEELDWLEEEAERIVADAKQRLSELGQRRQKGGTEQPKPLA